MLSCVFHAGVLALPLAPSQSRYDQAIPIEVVTGFEKAAVKPAAERKRSSAHKRLTAVSPSAPSSIREQPEDLKPLPDTSAGPPPAPSVELPAPDRSPEIPHTPPAAAAEISPVDPIDRKETIFFAEIDTARDLSKIEPEYRSRTASGENTGSRSNRVGPAVSQPLYTYTPKPEYPDQARREGWEGTVLLRVLVSGYGRPERIEISRSSGYPALDRAAQRAVEKWRFQPATSGGRELESWVRIPIVFRLEDLDR